MQYALIRAPRRRVLLLLFGGAVVGCAPASPDPMEEGVEQVDQAAPPPDAGPIDAEPSDPAPDAEPPDPAPDAALVDAPFEPAPDGCPADCEDAAGATPSVCFNGTCSRMHGGDVPAACGGGDCADPLVWARAVLLYRGGFDAEMAGTLRALDGAGARAVCVAVSPRDVEDVESVCAGGGGLETVCRAATPTGWLSHQTGTCNAGTAYAIHIAEAEVAGAFGGVGLSGTWSSRRQDGHGPRRTDWAVVLERQGDLTDAPLWARAGTSRIQGQGTFGERMHDRDEGPPRWFHTLSAVVAHPDGRRWQLEADLAWRGAHRPGSGDVCATEPWSGAASVTVVDADGAERIYRIEGDGEVACDGLTPVTLDGEAIAPWEGFIP